MTIFAWSMLIGGLFAQLMAYCLRLRFKVKDLEDVLQLQQNRIENDQRAVYDLLYKIQRTLETLPFNAFPQPGVTRVDPPSSTEAPAEEEPSKVQLPSLRIPHPSKPLERKPLNHNWRQP